MQKLAIRLRGIGTLGRRGSSNITLVFLHVQRVALLAAGAQDQ
jgi:hypothetical protein